MFWLAAALLIAAQSSAGPSAEDGIAAAAAGDNARAVAIWTPLARSGDPEANYRLAEAYQNGRGVPVSILRARQLYGRAAKQCHAPAQTSLALLDIATGQRPAALKLLRIAAANNEPRALLFYGLALWNGDGVPVERERGFEMIKRSAALGLADARQTLSEVEVAMLAANPDAAAPPPPTASVAPVLSRPGRNARRPVARSATADPIPRAAPFASAPMATPGGGWRIQLGAFRRAGAPQELFAQIASRLPGVRPFYPVQNGLTALQVGPFATRAEAQEACRSAAVRPCVPIRTP